jgi:hypothetical protein
MRPIGITTVHNRKLSTWRNNSANNENDTTTNENNAANDEDDRTDLERRKLVGIAHEDSVYDGFKYKFE